jgi:hypothetical protein
MNIAHVQCLTVRNNWDYRAHTLAFEEGTVAGVCCRWPKSCE